MGGVLLVTPNAIMFDPNVSDPLVIEHGPESYGVIAPMEFVVNAAIYYDIAHMRVAGPYPPTGYVYCFFPNMNTILYTVLMFLLFYLFHVETITVELTMRTSQNRLFIIYLPLLKLNYWKIASSSPQQC